MRQLSGSHVSPVPVRRTLPKPARRRFFVRSPARPEMLVGNSRHTSEKGR